MSSSSAAAAPAVCSGVWDGSEVDDDHIEFLHRTRRLPSADLMLWGEFFSSKLGTHIAGVPAQCGAFIVMRCSTADNPFPPITLIKSVKMWQRSYFYVKNLASDGDWVNLPPYNAAPLTGRLPS